MVCSRSECWKYCGVCVEHMVRLFVGCAGSPFPYYLDQCLLPRDGCPCVLVDDHVERIAYQFSRMFVTVLQYFALHPFGVCSSASLTSVSVTLDLIEGEFRNAVCFVQQCGKLRFSVDREIVFASVFGTVMSRCSLTLSVSTRTVLVLK